MAYQVELLDDEILEIIKNKQWTQLKRRSLNWPPSETVAPEILDIYHHHDKADQVLLYRSLPKSIAAEVFACMETADRDHLLRSLADHETRELIENLSPDDRTDVLAELPGQVTQYILNLLDKEDLAEARKLLGYPEDSVGRLMTPDYVTVLPEWTVEYALEQIRRRARRSETIDMIYVRDKNWRLLDALPLKQFILSKPDTLVSDIMDDNFISLSAYDDREEAVRKIQKYDRVALPVVDSDGILIGIVTVDDIIDVAEEETTEDFHKSAAVSPFRMTYKEAGLWILYKSRIGWLSTLLFVSLISSGVISAFEEVLHASIALAFFVPLIIGTGGNAGAQSATVLIRALSTGEVDLTHWAKVFLKELLVGLTIGISLGILGFFLGTFRESMQLGLVVLLTMTVMLTITNLLGMTLPFLFMTLKLDPAVASGPLITSIADAVGLTVYFSIATLIL